MSKQVLFCRHCKKEKQISEFYKGSPRQCKNCIKAKYKGYKKEYYEKNKKRILKVQKEWHKKNPDKVKIYREKHAEKRAEYYRNWYKTNGRKRTKDVKEYYSLWRKRNLIAYRAQCLVTQAVKWGFLKKPKHCESCTRERKVISHHKDYSKPMEVTWLCYSCHAKLNFKKSS